VTDDSGHWRASSDSFEVYAPDERFVVHLCERAIIPRGAVRQCVVQLYRDNYLREEITTEPTTVAARKQMQEWLIDYPVLITD
jgi:hypothetical protein